MASPIAMRPTTPPTTPPTIGPMLDDLLELLLPPACGEPFEDCVSEGRPVRVTEVEDGLTDAVDSGASVRTNMRKRSAVTAHSLTLISQGLCCLGIESIVGLSHDELIAAGEQTRDERTVMSRYAHAGTAVPAGIGSGYLHRSVSQPLRVADYCELTSAHIQLSSSARRLTI